MSALDRLMATVVVAAAVTGALVVAAACLDRPRTTPRRFRRLRSALRGLRRVLVELEEELLRAAERGADGG